MNVVTLCPAEGSGTRLKTRVSVAVFQKFSDAFILFAQASASASALQSRSVEDSRSSQSFSSSVVHCAHLNPVPWLYEQICMYAMPAASSSSACKRLSTDPAARRSIALTEHSQADHSAVCTDRSLFPDKLEEQTGCYRGR
jgi:hypothetical protein